MKHVEKWLWRFRWGGRMVTGTVHYTDSEIRARHPEAQRVDSSMIVVEVPETPAEIEAAYEAMRRPPRNVRPD